LSDVKLTAEQYLNNNNNTGLFGRRFFRGVREGLQYSIYDDGIVILLPACGGYEDAAIL